MTPIEHKAAAETAIEKLAGRTPTTPPGLGPSDDDFNAALTHAVLSKAAGTGEHYTTADSLLATWDDPTTRPGPQGRRWYLLREAHVRALLAD